MWRLANRTPAVSSDLSLQSKERRHNELTILAYASDLPDGAPHERKSVVEAAWVQLYPAVNKKMPDLICHRRCTFAILCHLVRWHQQRSMSALPD